MTTFAAIETLAFELSEADRARLASALLDSLPGVLVDDDEGLAEALRRSDEMDRDSTVCLSHEEFLKAVPAFRMKVVYHRLAVIPPVKKNSSDHGLRLGVRSHRERATLRELATMIKGRTWGTG